MRGVAGDKQNVPAETHAAPVRVAPQTKEAARGRPFHSAPGFPVTC
jgi:hypothetical protein